MKPFGKMLKMYGMVTYQLSPFEQKPFYGFFKGLTNYVINYGPVYLPWIIPAPLVSYMVWDWGCKDWERRQHKNPKDFENDV